MSHATILSMLLIAISISGCAGTKPIIPVPQKCINPYTPEPVMDNTPCPKGDGSEAAKSARYKCVHNKVLKNVEAKNKHAEELKNNSEVCK